MRILFIAPASNLKTGDEVLRSLEGQTVSLCAGEVDREKVEAYLARGQFEAIHFGSHGSLSVLDWSDGRIEVAQLLDLLANQKRLKFVCITACNSARVGAEIHNAFHIPVILCQAGISDPGALTFSETFYRSVRLVGDIHRAVESGRAQLRAEHPTDADVVTLINGDMATDAELDDCMSYVRESLTGMAARLERIEAGMKELKTQQPKTWLAVIVLLGLVALGQWVSPWLLAAAR